MRPDAAALATLTFAARHALWLVAAAAAVVVSLSVWSYCAAGAARGVHRVGGVLLKALGVAALAFCLLEPLWSGPRARPGANVFAVVADNSQGLQVADGGETQTRAALLQTWLGPAGGDWQERLEQHFELRRFLFDSSLRATRDFRDLTFAGQASAIGGALRRLAAQFQGRPFAGILLFTDGNATDLRGPLPAANGLPPIYPVVVGSAGAIRDLALGQVQVSQVAFEDAPVSVQAEVSATCFAGENIVARLLEATGRAVKEQSLRARKHEDRLAFRFQWRPEQPGLSFYRLLVRTQDEAPATNRPAHSREATLLNNARVIAVDRGQGQHRLLYVGGRPNWEYKFLNRALQEDPQLQLVALLRVALREPKFDFRGRSGETGNPLFRGFDNQAREEVERYDQPVLSRLNTRDDLELRGGFPRTPEALYGYHAIIIDDLEAAFFSADQAALVQRFVSERGGGLLMLGGINTFQSGAYQNTPIGDMLPVYLDRFEETNAPGPLRFDLAREGWLEPWVRLRETEAAEKARLQALTPFQVFNRVRRVKPGASVLATVSDESGALFPALVTERFGRGRTAALTIGDIWRWGLHDPAAHQDMDKMWRQLARWLVSDVPERVELAVEPSESDAPGAVRLVARVRDTTFQPLDYASVTFEVHPVLGDAPIPTNNTVRLRAEPSAKEPGLYEATYVAHLTAGYQAAALATNSLGVAVGTAQAGWSTDLAADEFRSLQPNVAWLESIARQTGGQLVPAAKLAQFARQLPARQAPVMETWTRPAWHTPFAFGFALACFVAEWAWRRSRGLP